MGLSGGTVSHSVDDSRMKLYNYTHEDHGFSAGYVERSIIVEDNKIFVKCLKKNLVYRMQNADGSTLLTLTSHAEGRYEFGFFKRGSVYIKSDFENFMDAYPGFPARCIEYILEQWLPGRREKVWPSFQVWGGLYLNSIESGDPSLSGSRRGPP